MGGRSGIGMILMRRVVLRENGYCALSGFVIIGSISDGMGWDGIAYAGLIH